jgi:hypothetical protein
VGSLELRAARFALTVTAGKQPTGEWCRLAPDDIVALRALKTVGQKKTAPEVESPEAVFSPPVSSLYAARVSSRVASDVTNSDSQYGIPAI